MYFSRSLIASALIGLGMATMHEPAAKMEEVQSYAAQPYEVKSYEVKPPEMKSYAVNPPEVKSYAAQPYEVKSYEVKSPEVKSYEVKPPEMMMSYGAKPSEVKSYEVKASPTQEAVMASETAAAAMSAAAPKPTAAAAAAAAGGGMVVTHVVQVGGPNGSLTFSPDNVKANPGELVQFQFHPKNHSVVQSTFDSPCVPMQNSTASFFSGFMPTNASASATSNVLTYTIRVTDTKPIWYYCSQAKHCQGGMVGAINAAATGNKTMSAFKALAAQAKENLSPGQAPGSGSGSGAASPSSPTAPGAESSAGAGGASPGQASSSPSSPAEQSVNAAHSMYDASRQSLFSLALGGLVAVLLL